MLCKKCGKALQEGAKFCDQCGQTVELEPSSFASNAEKDEFFRNRK